MATDGKVPIMDSVRAGYAAMRGSISVVLPAAALLAVFNAASQTLLEPDASPNMALGWVFLVLTLLLSVAFTSLLYRLVMREDASGFFGLKFGPDEINLLGVTLAVLFLFVIIATIVGVILTFVFIAVMAGAGVDFASLEGDPAAASAAIRQIFSTPGGLVFLALALVSLIGIVWVGARLSLVPAATMGEGRMMAFSTWHWTKGNGWRILLALLIVVIPPIIVSAIPAGIIGALFAAATGNAEAASKATPGNLAPFALTQFLVGLGQFALAAPGQAGLLAYLYRGLRPPDLGQPH